MLKLVYSGFLLLPSSLLAQNSLPVQRIPKVYVGLGANTGRYYDKRTGDFIKRNLLYSPAVVVGVQLVPNVALQLSATTYEYKSGYTASVLDYTKRPNDPLVGYIQGSTHRRYYILPLLARYTFTDEGRRLRFDGLLGTSIYHSRERNTTVLTTAQFEETDRYSYFRSATYANLVVGTGLRYAATSQLEIASELRANLFYFGYSAGINPNLELSLRYGFGTLKSN